MKKVEKKKIYLEDFHSKSIQRLYTLRISRLAVQFTFLFIANLSLGFLIPLPIIGLSYPWTSFPGAFDMLQIMIILLIPPLLPLATILIFNITFGRLFCGWICPFGLAQDLVNYLLGSTRHISLKLHQKLKPIKYVILFLLFLFFISLAYLTSIGALERFAEIYGKGISIMPYTSFAPDATLFGTFPLLFDLGLLPASFEAFSSAFNAGLITRYFILLLILFFISKVTRFWCRYVCPMGALNSIFSSKSIIGIYRQVGSCDECGLCTHICPMQIDVVKAKIGRIDSKECIMCFECVAACHSNALKITIKK